MNKMTKGAIAGGIGVALLLGGAGTLAYWNDSASLSAPGTITAGNLAIAAPATAPASDGWKVTNGTISNQTVADISTFKIVPGDSLTYTKTLNVTATGNNIRAKVTLGTNAISGATTAAADTALAARLTASASYTVNGTAGASYTIPSAGTYPVVVTVTINWPFGVTGSPTNDNPAKLGVVDLTDFNVVVTQVQP